MLKTLLMMTLVLVSIYAQAAIKCAPVDDDGAMCCWDTTTQGPWTPVDC